MPGGHLVTSVALSGIAYATTRSPEISAGCFLGGFLIDADHYFDYIVVERQWRRWTPQEFLRYYFETAFQWVVLPRHSYELLAVLVGISAWFGFPLLVGYVAGAIMHLLFDIMINGEQALREPVKFYSFAFRMSRGFRMSNLLHPPTAATESSLKSQFWSVRHAQPKPEEPRTPERTAND
jgi:hypothetical protein